MCVTAHFILVFEEHALQNDLFASHSVRCQPRLFFKALQHLFNTDTQPVNRTGQ